jgi:phage terminase large subunit-like protein
VKLACQRHLADLDRSTDASFPYRFDEAKATRPCRFIQALPHVKGRWAAERQLLRLEPWQVFIVANIFGWVRKDNGLRKHRQAFLLIPRKNGKSPLAAGIGLYMLTCDDPVEVGAEIYCGATSEKQAWEVFRPAKLMADKTPDLQSALGVSINAKSIVTANGSRFEPVIGKPGDGASVSLGICDEYHEADTAILYDTFKTGMVGRQQPLLLVITTAGYNVASPCHDLQLEAQKVLEGTLEDDQLFSMIFTVDADTDWTGEEALRLANPNLGISVDETALQHDQEQAVQNPAKQNVFKTKHLNIWCNASSAWLNMQRWKECEDHSLEPEQFVNDSLVMAVDLASTTDLSSAVKVFTRTIDGKPHYYIFGRHYLPEAKIGLPENQHYQRWNLAVPPVLMATDGASIDYPLIERDLRADISTYKVREICFDKTYAGQMMQQLAATGVTTVEVPQKVMYLSPAMKALEAAVADGRCHHNGDPVLTWCLSNVVAHADANDNYFPRKEKPNLKIDAAVALITAFARVASTPDPNKKPSANDIYERRGVRTL